MYPARLLSDQSMMATKVEELDELKRLQYRVDQQSTLITMLKQRSDKTQGELSECEQKYELSQKQVEKLQQLLAEVSAAKALFEERFHTLAENHEQMIRIKDGYKVENCRLRESQGKDTSTVEQLKEELKKLDSEKLSLVRKCEQLECHVSEEKRKREADSTAHQFKIEEMTTGCSKEMSILQEKVERLQMTVKKMTEESENKSNQLSELQKNTEHLKQLLASNDTHRQEHLATIQSLKTKLFQTTQELEQTRRSHMAELSRDSCISKLRRELQETQQKLSCLEEEYSAYKTHSNHLLSHERELNNKLRHLLD